MKVIKREFDDQQSKHRSHFTIFYFDSKILFFFIYLEVRTNRIECSLLGLSTD